MRLPASALVVTSVRLAYSPKMPTGRLSSPTSRVTSASGKSASLACSPRACGDGGDGDLAIGMAASRARTAVPCPSGMVTVGSGRPPRAMRAGAGLLLKSVSVTHR